MCIVHAAAAWGLFPLELQTWVPGFLFSGRYESICVQEWKTELWKQIKTAYKVFMKPLKKLGDAFTGRMCQQLHWLHTRSFMSQFSALCFSSFLWLFCFYLSFDSSPDDWSLVKYRNHFGHLALSVCTSFSPFTVARDQLFISRTKKPPKKLSCIVWSLTSFLPKSLWQQRLNTYHNRREAMLCSDWLVKSRTNQRSHNQWEFFHPLKVTSVKKPLLFQSKCRWRINVCDPTASWDWPETSCQLQGCDTLTTRKRRDGAFRRRYRHLQTSADVISLFQGISHMTAPGTFKDCRPSSLSFLTSGDFLTPPVEKFHVCWAQRGNL